MTLTDEQIDRLVDLKKSDGSGTIDQIALELVGLGLARITTGRFGSVNLTKLGQAWIASNRPDVKTDFSATGCGTLLTALGIVLSLLCVIAVIVFGSAYLLSQA